jgi:integral membrane sensor domain MASE1
VYPFSQNVSLSLLSTETSKRNQSFRKLALLATFQAKSIINHPTVKASNTQRQLNLSSSLTAAVAYFFTSDMTIFSSIEKQQAKQTQ